MTIRTTEELLDELSLAIMTVQVDDAKGVEEMALTLEDLGDILTADGSASLDEARAALAAYAAADEGARIEPFAAAVAAVQAVIERMNGTAVADDAEAAPAGELPFQLPPWVEEDVFDEFVAQQRVSFEGIDGDLHALSEGSDDALSDLRGRIHTLKGESGLLGLRDVESVCHTLEDAFDVDGFTVDVAYAARDWMAEAIQAYGEREAPAEPVEVILGQLRAFIESGSLPGQDDTEVESASEDAVAAEDEPAVDEPEAEESIEDDEPAEDDEPEGEEVAAEAPPEAPTSIEEHAHTPVDRANLSQAVVWNEDDLEILIEFLTESEDGLTTADEILLSAGNAALDAEQVDHLFRVYHTIKGVAGFLELTAISTLAHTTETLLDHARKGVTVIGGANLDLVFDATEMMRRLVTELRAAITEGRAPADDALLPTLIGRLEAAIAGKEVSAAPLVPTTASAPADDVPAPAPAAPAAAPAPAPVAAPKAAKAAAPVAGPAATPAANETKKRSGNSPKATRIKEIVKIDLERVDNLVSLIGELVIVEAMLVNAPELKAQASPWLRDQLSQMSKITRDLQDIGTRMRMVPVRGVFQKMSRIIRDLSRKGGKPTKVVLSGEGTEMDRSMVEQLGDPLIHMVRNAVDHGLETVEDRLAAGKPREGTISLSAYHQGGSVIIEVSDDGKGLDREAIVAKAISQGLIKDAEKMSDAEVYDLIFAPGFSTAKKITEISGRGVGMDVVRRNIESVRGRITIDSAPGRGSTFTMVLPLTLAIIDGLLITCGPERYIIPTLSVVESLKPERSMIFTVAGRGELVSVRGQTYPLFRLDKLLHVPEAVQDPVDALVVIVEARGRRLGLLVDDVLYQQQVVIKSLGNQSLGTEFLSGAAILSDGLVGLILNTDELADLADRRPPRLQRDGQSAA